MNTFSYLGVGRSGKNTHISMISNSVTHLRSYINTAIAYIASNSARSPMSPHRAPTSPHRPPSNSQCCRARHRRLHRMNEECFMMFHIVLSGSWYFTSGSWCFTSGSWCFTSSSWCFTSSSCFTSGSWCFTSGSWCFSSVHYVLRWITMFNMCFMMFYYV